MNIDREKDVEILQKIFGVKKIYYESWDLKNEYPEYIPSGKPWRTHKIDARPVPYFYTNIGAAFEVVPKMKSPPLLFRFRLESSQSIPSENRTGEFKARFWNHKREGKANHENPATAICLAARKAVEV